MIEITKIQAEKIVGVYGGINIAPVNSAFQDKDFGKKNPNITSAEVKVLMDSSDLYYLFIDYLPENIQAEIIVKLNG